MAFAVTLTSASARSFEGVTWVQNTTEQPHQDSSGSGITPSTSGAMNNQGRFDFEISTSSTSSTQRQEWKYDRHEGLTRMDLRFRINSKHTNFHKISIAQCHDDQSGSEGVFSIYQVRREGDKYYFGVQGDVEEADNVYSQFPTTEIKFDTWYSLSIRTNTDGRNNSYEYGAVRDVNNGNKVIWTNTIVGGGDSESYYKLGAYRLTGGEGPFSVSFEQIMFFEGS